LLVITYQHLSSEQISLSDLQWPQALLENENG